MNRSDGGEPSVVVEVVAEEAGAQSKGSSSTDSDELASVLIEQVLEARAVREGAEMSAEAERAARLIHGVVIGRVVAIRERGPQVDYPGCPAPGGLVARSASSLSEQDVGRRVALLFEGGEPALPMLVGPLVHDDPAAESEHPAMGSLRFRESRDHIELACTKPIRLRCGEASITLTPKGRIVVRGTYVLTRATITNRIRGGSVRIN